MRNHVDLVADVVDPLEVLASGLLLRELAQSHKQGRVRTGVNFFAGRALNGQRPHDAVAPGVKGAATVPVCEVVALHGHVRRRRSRSFSVFFSHRLAKPHATLVDCGTVNDNVAAKKLEERVCSCPGLTRPRLQLLEQQLAVQGC